MTSAFSLETPRAPDAPARAGLYESHYLTAAEPGGGRAVWLRYTADKRPGEAATGRLWCTFFDAGRPPLARRTTVPGVLRRPAPGRWVGIGGSEIGPTGAHGQLEDCAWSLTWRPAVAPLPYLPSARLYDRRLPRSNGAAIVPDTLLDGRLEVGGDSIELTGWRGMVGHNWGSDHADRWMWLHAPGLGARDPEGWLDLIVVRVRIGRRLTPWLPSGALQLDGRRHLIRASAARGLRAEVGAERLLLELPRLAGRSLRLETESPAGQTARWDYVTPHGSAREVSHCSIASARLTLGTGDRCMIDGAFSVELGG